MKKVTILIFSFLLFINSFFAEKTFATTIGTSFLFPVTGSVNYIIDFLITPQQVRDFVITGSMTTGSQLDFYVYYKTIDNQLISKFHVCNYECGGDVTDFSLSSGTILKFTGLNVGLIRIFNASSTSTFTSDLILVNTENRTIPTPIPSSTPTADPTPTSGPGPTSVPTPTSGPLPTFVPTPTPLINSTPYPTQSPEQIDADNSNGIFGFLNLTKIANFIILIFGRTITFVIMAFPGSPFGYPSYPPNSINLGYITWLLDFPTWILHLQIILACVFFYYIIRIVARWLKLLGD